jgi:hypothetical protein
MKGQYASISTVQLNGVSKFLLIYYHFKLNEFILPPPARRLGQVALMPPFAVYGHASSQVCIWDSFRSKAAGVVKLTTHLYPHAFMTWCLSAVTTALPVTFSSRLYPIFVRYSFVEDGLAFRTEMFQGRDVMMQ